MNMETLVERAERLGVATATVGEMLDELERLREKVDYLADGMRDVFPSAHRLALELECLLLDTKDTAAVSKWWDSANEALEQWREFCREETHNVELRGTVRRPLDCRVSGF